MLNTNLEDIKVWMTAATVNTLGIAAVFATESEAVAAEAAFLQNGSMFSHMPATKLPLLFGDHQVVGEKTIDVSDIRVRRWSGAVFAMAWLDMRSGRMNGAVFPFMEYLQRAWSSVQNAKHLTQVTNKIGTPIETGEKIHLRYKECNCEAVLQVQEGLFWGDGSFFANAIWVDNNVGCHHRFMELFTVKPSELSGVNYYILGEPSRSLLENYNIRYCLRR